MDIPPTPTQPSPLGCSLGVLGVLCLLGAVFSGWLFWEIWQRPELDAQRELLWQSGGFLLGGLLAGSLLLTIGWRMAQDETRR